MTITREAIAAACAKLGYKYFESGSYNMNVIGVRNSSTGNRVTNAFDDWMTLSYKDDNGVWHFHAWPCTTDNGGGTARVVPGQYPACHCLGLHQGKYQALKQCGNITVYRDHSDNGLYDEVDTQTGVFGINIHKAGKDSILVGDWSHGCQVFKRTKDFNEFMSIIKKDKGRKWTYTLIESKDIDNGK